MLLSNQDSATSLLTSDELAHATTLASELYDQDIQRNSAIRASDEIGVPPEYLARAISRMLAERSTGIVRREKRATSIRSVIMSLMATIGLAAILWPAAVLWKPDQSAYSSSVPSGASTIQSDLTAPLTKGTVSLTPIQIPAGTPLRLRMQNREMSTKIVFWNHSQEKATISWLDEMGKEHLLTTINPGKGYWSPTYVGVPWIARTDKKMINLYFPTSSQTVADIPDQPVSLQDSFAEGYLKPLTMGAQLPTQLPAAPNSWSSAIEFVNLKKSDVNVYAISTTRKATFITTLSPYHDFWMMLADAGTVWVVTDPSGKILETFVQPTGLQGTAVISESGSGGSS